MLDDIQGQLPHLAPPDLMRATPTRALTTSLDISRPSGGDLYGVAAARGMVTSATGRVSLSRERNRHAPPASATAATTDHRIASTTSEQLRTAEDVLARLDHVCVDVFERNANQEKWWPSTYTRSGTEVFSPEKHAIRRLLDLKLAIYREAPEQVSPWHYEWTYLGHQVVALWRQRSRGRGRFDSVPVMPTANATDASDKPSA